MSDPDTRSGGTIDRHLSRRQLLTGAGAALGAAFLVPEHVSAGFSALGSEQEERRVHRPGNDAIVFTNTTVITGDAHRAPLVDVALAVRGDRIAAIGSTESVLAHYPGAEVVDGRHKALLPGLMNCHAHLSATIARGFNEDFGFPNRAGLEVSPASLLSTEERTLMSVVAAVESIRCGATTVVQYTGGIAPEAEELARTGLRWVFAEAANDRIDGSVMSPERLAASEPPRFSPTMRDAGMQRIEDLFSAWHGHDHGRIQVFPSVVHTENASPELLQDAALGGAHAVQKPDDLGLLEVGRKADLIVLDTRKPHLVPHGRVLSVRLHNGQPSDVESVMVDGRFIMRDHRVLTVDEDAIVAEASRVGRRVWDEVQRTNPVTPPGRSTSWG